MRLILFALLIISFIPVAARAGDSSRVAEVRDGDHIVMAHGLVVRLAGAHAPFESDGAKVVQDFLTKLVLNKHVYLQDAGPDRYGNMMAQVYVIEGNRKIWVQALLIEKGLSFAYPMAEAADVIHGLLKVEAQARAKRIGLWDETAYQDLPAEEAETRLNHYAFVTGRVVSVRRGRDHFYLNFGEDWRKSFSVTVPESLARALKREGMDVATLEGKRIRVRGFIDKKLAPYILLSDKRAAGGITLLPN